jgi:ParB family chromosome partitioning protein
MSIQKKPTLGRGLADLLGQTATARPANAAGPGSTTGSVPGGEELAKLPVNVLQRGKYQPRVDMREEALKELAASIKSQGVVQPIVVRPVPPPAGETVRYEIIAGERRWRAAQIAGLTEIPAVIRRIPDEAAIAMALIENIQRENLNPLEEARALQRLITEFDLTHQEAADAVGRSRAGVSNLLRLLELAPEVCELVERRSIEMGHARALLGLDDRQQQVELATMVAEQGLTVRATEELVRRKLEPVPRAPVAPPPPPPRLAASTALDDEPRVRDPNVDRLEQELADKLGAKVAIQQSDNGKGRLVVSYNSLDELDGIIAHIR